MTNYKTIVIDDESIARQRLIRLLNEHPQTFQVIAEAQNGIEGAALINRLKPDLVFLDIQMPGKTGFEMLEDLEFVPSIVFCTAYEEYALKAFDTFAVDYLVKPVEAQRLQLTIDKLSRRAMPFQTTHIKELLAMMTPRVDEKKLQSIPHKTGDRVLLIKTDTICYLKAQEKYVEFFTVDGKKYLTELSLKQLTERLPDAFRQVQRSLIVNVNFVKEYRKYFRGKYILVLDDLHATKLETGRSFTDEVEDILAVR